jgi:hypothetical protein
MWWQVTLGPDRLTLRKTKRVLIESHPGWTPGPVCTLFSRDKYRSPFGVRILYLPARSLIAILTTPTRLFWLRIMYVLWLCIFGIMCVCFVVMYLWNYVCVCVVVMYVLNFLKRLQSRLGWIPRVSGVPRGVWGFNPPPPRNSEVLTKLSRIPSSVENTSVTTVDILKVWQNRIANWVEPLTRGLQPPDPRSVCPLSSTEFVEPPPPPRTKFLGTPLPLVEVKLILAYDICTVVTNDIKRQPERNRNKGFGIRSRD